MGPDGSGHRQEISSSETSFAIDRRESRMQINWLAFDSLQTFLSQSRTTELYTDMCWQEDNSNQPS